MSGFFMPFLTAGLKLKEYEIRNNKPTLHHPVLLFPVPAGNQTILTIVRYYDKPLIPPWCLMIWHPLIVWDPNRDYSDKSKIQGPMFFITSTRPGTGCGCFCDRPGAAGPRSFRHDPA